MNKRFFAAVLLAWPLAAAAQTKGEMWEITMGMPGMPAGMMPAQRVCQGDDPSRAATQDPSKKNCKVTSSKKTANGQTVTLSCPDGSTMTIDQQYNAARTEFKSTMTSKGGRDGDMTMNVTGRKVGACDAVAENKARDEKMAATKKQAEAAIAGAAAQNKRSSDERIQRCKAAVESMDHRVFDGPCSPNMNDKQCTELKASVDRIMPEVGPACRASQVEYCKRFQTAEGFLKAKGNENAAQMCGVSTASIKAAQCPRVGKTKSPLVFLGSYCPVEAKPLAFEQCFGRDYTARNEGPYGAFCSAYLANKDFERPPRQAKDSSDQPKSQSEKTADQVQQGVSKGIDKIKGLFGR